MNSYKKEGGFIKFLIILIIALLIASYYFHFSLRDLVESPQTQENVSYLKEKGQDIYRSYIKPFIEEHRDDVWNFLKGAVVSTITGDQSHFEKEKEKVLGKFLPKGMNSDDKNREDESQEKNNE